jgi:hypothetical protein
LTLDGPGFIQNASGGNHDALANSLATNYGTLTLQNNATLTLSQTFTNAGTLNIQSGSTLDLTHGAFGNVDANGVLNGGNFNMAGTLIYNGPAITAIGSTASLALGVGNGSFLNGLGQEQLANSLVANYGTLTWESGAQLTLGSQTFTNYGTIHIQANSVLDLTNGNLGNVSGNGTLTGGTYWIGGYLLYSGNDIVTLGANTSLTLDGSGERIYNTNSGNTLLETLTTNEGTLTLENGAFIYGGNPFTNDGTVVVANGSNFTVDTGGDNYTQTGGSTQIDGVLNAGTADVQGGTLNGAGTIDGTLLNEGGTVAPGDGAPGVLTVSDFTQTAGTLLFDIQGTQAGVDYSQLLVTNAAIFGGNIEFDFADGFTPQNGQIYTFIDYGSYTGTFGDNYIFENLPAGYTADVIYGASDLEVTFTAPTPEPGTIALMLAGLGFMALAWGRRTHFPGNR